MDFIVNNLFLIILALIVLMVIGFVFRALKTVLFIGIIILVLGFLGVFGDGFNEKAKNTFDTASTYTQERAMPYIKENLSTAEFTFNKETGAYVIGSKKFQVSGTEGSNRGTFTVGNNSTELDVSFLSDYINEQIAKQPAQ